MNWDEGHWDEGFWDDPGPSASVLPVKTRKKTRTYMNNPTPDDDDVLQALADDMADGCHDHEVPIGIKQNTETVMRAAITGMKSAKLTLANLKMAITAKSEAVKTADAAATTVLTNCRLRFIKLHGYGFNAGWEAAGFPNQSTAVPKTPDKRFATLSKVVDYLTATPTAESADMDVTVAICTAALTTLSNARHELDTAETAQSNGLKARDTAVTTLRKRVRSLIDELALLLADDSTLWESFGLNIPAHPSPPEPIASLTASALGGGKVLLQWPYATRMTGTRVLAKHLGEDDDFISLGTVDGLTKLVEDETPGVIIEFKVIAYNDGGDASASPVASVGVT